MKNYSDDIANTADLQAEITKVQFRARINTIALAVVGLIAIVSYWF